MNKKFRLLCMLGVVGASLVLVGLEACVGDDPSSPASSADASTEASGDASSPSSDGGACQGIDTQTSAANCGACGHACSTGFACTAGVCGNQPVQIAGGNGTACVLLANGDVYCWGYNGFGGVGTGDNSPAPLAKKVATDSTGAPFGGATSVAVGYAATCALNKSNNVFCWGENKEAIILGQAIGTTALKPTDLRPLDGLGTKGIALGAGHDCALDSDGTVKCWGWNAYDQDGHDGGADGDQNVCIQGPGPENGGVGDLCNQQALAVAGVSGASQIVATSYNSCALEGENVYCWGRGRDDGSNEGVNGNGNGSDAGATASPTEISSGAGPLTGVAAITGGNGGACAITIEKTLLCWGVDEYGQLGDNSTASPKTIPVQFGSLSNVTSASVGAHHVCAVSDGNVYCAGYNGQLQLGGSDCLVDSGLPDGGGVCESRAPVAVSLGGALLSNVIQVAALGLSTCALTADGKVYCWGYNADGDLGHSPGTAIGDTNCAYPPATAITTEVPCDGTPTLVGGLP